ncbi:hypothetical protein LZK98_04520 [Sphingomonas cannabina]|uniref:hypothetical protein n=1 Tax=Sphingomonas cannabina TaxID=2899123 RepID=UPI001F31C7AA|nr:hypothetical protein [Sphingomonas cannabina]UIJ46217.1 hypothetical protein LZK98_04520 [Sphingomonas cannabina]
MTPTQLPVEQILIVFAVATAFTKGADGRRTLTNAAKSAALLAAGIRDGDSMEGRFRCEVVFE